jgi:exo-1,4-beta-D-glucosaminidase
MAGLFSSMLFATTLVVGVACTADSKHAPIVRAAGQTSVIDGWSLQTSSKVSTNMTAVSQPGFDVSSWYRVGSHGTVMVGSNSVQLLLYVRQSLYKI